MNDHPAPDLGDKQSPVGLLVVAETGDLPGNQFPVGGSRLFIEKQSGSPADAGGEIFFAKERRQHGEIDGVLQLGEDGGRRGDLFVAVGELAGEFLGRDVSEGGIDILDDGPGLSEDTAIRMLRPFESGRPDGTGLGLPLALKWLNAQGADLRLERRPEGGTCASIRW